MQPSYHPVNQRYLPVVQLFAMLKVALNLLAAPHYGFHRDELLHLALGDHLGWGYKEVPPLIGGLAYIILHVFGGSLMAARIFPAIAAGFMVWVSGLLAIEFGGRRLAVVLTCLCLLASPAFIASDYLFQPVVFDQLWWLVSAWLAVRYVHTQKVNYLYWLGAVTGVGMLTKYSMAFFAFATLLGLLLTPQRKLILNKHLLIALLITTLIFLPNIIWQYSHHWPFLTHMHKLKQQQLDAVSPLDFVKQQLLVNGLLLLVWLGGLLYLMVGRQLAAYRFVALTYVLVFLFLLVMHGKSYYLFGAYPMLFAAGGCLFELKIKNWAGIWRVALVVILMLPGLIIFPVLLPVFSVKTMLRTVNIMHRRMPSLNFLTTWEDNRVHPLTQDYADMFGWEEMAHKSATIYHSLPPKQQAQTVIFTDNYGEAAAIHKFHLQYHVPDVVSLNSSFAMWAPSEMTAQNIIYISDDDDVSDLVPLSTKVTRSAGVTNLLARERGTGIYLIEGIKPALKAVYYQHWQQEMSQ